MIEDINTGNRKSGMVSIVGRANVGKSTLLNRIIGEKVSIVSPVPQTTRLVVRAILNDARGQIAFLDTPGVHRAPTDLGRIMNRAARKSVEGVDALLLVLDPSEPPRDEDRGWLNRLTAQETPAVIFMNKQDIHPAFESAFFECLPASAAPVLKGSAETGEGVDALTDALFDCMPVGPPLFPEDVLTDFPRRLAMADVIREKYFLRLQQEIPHQVAVRVEDLEEGEGRWRAHVHVLVRRESQKGILIGHKGRMLRAVKRAASKELESMFGLPIDLDVHIKTEKNWERNIWIMKQLGYVE